jgi:hypothetical protein
MTYRLDALRKEALALQLAGAIVDGSCDPDSLEDIAAVSPTVRDALNKARRWRYIPIPIDRNDPVVGRAVVSALPHPARPSPSREAS